jgi:hypothetical protein
MLLCLDAHKPALRRESPGHDVADWSTAYAHPIRILLSLYMIVYIVSRVDVKIDLPLGVCINLGYTKGSRIIEELEWSHNSIFHMTGKHIRQQNKTAK